MCDARGHGASGGVFGLDGPRDVQDVRDEFTWFTERPEVSDTQIGAFGISLGGGAVWNATAAGVPFKAIVPTITWTDLNSALAPQGLSKSGLVAQLAQQIPTARWDPALLAAEPELVRSDNLAQVHAIAAARSVRLRLGRITTPTLLIQGRHDFLFDLDQALAAYRQLKGPKRLYMGDLGHPPAPNPAAERPTYIGEAVKWFDRFLKGTKNGIDRAPLIELAHDPWDGSTTTYPALPTTRFASLNFAGNDTLALHGKVVRTARLTGGPHETFGDSTVKVPYSGAVNWDRLVAVLTVAGNPVPISAGGVKLTGANGVATIRLMNESVRIPAGARLTLYLGATSTGQNGNPLYLQELQSPDAAITIGRVTLRLSTLTRAVSR
jgi:esterase/lipase